MGKTRASNPSRKHLSSQSRKSHSPPAKVHVSQLPKNFIYGINPVQEALKHGFIKRLYVLRLGSLVSRRIKDVLTQAREHFIPVEEMGEKPWFPALSSANHQGICGITKPFQGITIVELVEKLADPACVVLLDGVNDPHNLGAVIRNCAGAGAGVILPKNNVPKVNATVHKVSAGTTFLAPIVVGENLSQAIDTLKRNDYWIACLDPAEGESVFHFDFPRKLGVIIGREERGVRRRLSEKSDFHLRIPMTEGVDSLNLSSALAVTLFLFRAHWARRSE